MEGKFLEGRYYLEKVGMATRRGEWFAPLNQYRKWVISMETVGHFRHSPHTHQKSENSATASESWPRYAGSQFPELWAAS